MISHATSSSDKHSQPVYITHIQMRHKIHENLYTQICNDKESFSQLIPANFDDYPLEERIQLLKNSIAFSQYNLARIILTNPQSVVVREGLSYIIHQDKIDDEESCKEVKDLFQKINLLTTAFVDLSTDHKNSLIKHGGDKILLYLGSIPAIYPSIDYSSAKKLWEATHTSTAISDARALQEIAEEWQPIRELKAIEYSVEAAHYTGANSVLLLFGSKHCFTNQTHAGRYNVLFTQPIDTRFVLQAITSNEQSSASLRKCLQENDGLFHCSSRLFRLKKSSCSGKTFGNPSKIKPKQKNSSGK